MNRTSKFNKKKNKEKMPPQLFHSFGKTPFKNKSEIYSELMADLERVIIDDKYLEKSEIQEKIDVLCKWLCTTPKTSIYRLDNFADLEKLLKALKQDNKPDPSVHCLPDLPNEIVAVDCWNSSVPLDLKRYPDEIIVDAACGAAVLRGSHIYAPGIIGMPNGLTVDTKVSVFADVVGQCKKGLIKPYPENNKIYLGNGVLRQTRKQLFGKTAKHPCPQPGETILDMCAAPGNKTTHISVLMKEQGTIIALDKNPGKVARFKENCKGKNIKIFCYDATKAVVHERERSSACIDDQPPFEENHFDRVLLDTPCSALGQRPQLYNTITSAQLRSYVSLQRNLFFAAVRLLKPGGTLVYSTCTVTIAENEGIIAWALNRFPELTLKSVKDQIKTDRYGTHGYIIDGFVSENANKVRRFGPESDSVGFFIACLRKQYS
ncbi:putative methyltransferase NSUN6 isoform X4 [Pseudomyrmex gracilis]|uniref:putative methyltransferase NSUN6 isoform X4 n=1 Tax=Pseudomyrmex gracilis TaxID=219809 RepID=UPI000994CE56|nr:putative methyltransferase NSUN6 isoform X4 [Pseudomyrmex gracilis]